MSKSQAELIQMNRAGKIFQRNQLPVMQRMEQSMCGCSYGATSWAIRKEIDLILGKLLLSPGKQLLDLGAGPGWPGLYMAGQSGCDLTMIDISAEGLAIAQERAIIDNISGKITVTRSDIREMPYCDNSFDAITHSDVLCCLPGKQSVLSECHRVLKPNGQMIFSVIYIPMEVNEDECARAVKYGPPFVDIESNISYSEMLGLANWQIIETIDQSDQFLESAKLFHTIEQENSDEISHIMSNEDIQIRTEKLENLIELIPNKTLKREIYVVRPSS